MAQVLKNRESGFNQRALQERLVELGWKKSQIVLIDEDQGRSASHASGREGLQALVADVSLRKIGIIVSYEVSRLAWQPGHGNEPAIADAHAASDAT